MTIIEFSSNILPGTIYYLFHSLSFNNTVHNRCKVRYNASCGQLTDDDLSPEPKINLLPIRSVDYAVERRDGCCNLNQRAVNEIGKLPKTALLVRLPATPTKQTCKLDSHTQQTRDCQHLL